MIQRKMTNHFVVANKHIPFLLALRQGAKSAVAVVHRPSRHFNKQTAVINFADCVQRFNIAVE